MCLLVGCFFIFFICVCCIGVCMDVGCPCCREEHKVIGAAPAPQPKAKRQKRKLKLYSASDLFAHRCKHQESTGFQLDIACVQKKTQIEICETQPNIPTIVTTMASIETETTDFSSDSTPPPTTNKDLSSRRPLIKIFMSSSKTSHLWRICSKKSHSIAFEHF